MEDFNPDKNYVVNKNIAMRKGVTNIPVPEEKMDRFYIAIRENRIQFIFPEKPAIEYRDILKKYSFKWSPTRKAWVRKLTQNALGAKEEIKKLFEQLRRN